jgi:replicative DNA helicase
VTRRRDDEGGRGREAYAGAVPPNDLDAEAAVLSSCILKPRLSIGVVRGLPLEREHFYSEANAAIFEAICWCEDSGTPVDLVTIASRLRDLHRLEVIGGARYLAQIVDATPAVANVKAHAVIVREKWKRRRVIASGHAAIARGYLDTDEGAAEAFGELAGVLSEGAASSGESTSMMLDEALTIIVEQTVATQKRIDTGAVAGVSTSFGGLDRVVGGLCDRQLTFIGAPTGGGKSAIAGDLVLSTCAQGCEEVEHDGDGAPVLDDAGAPKTRVVPYGAAIFTMEMSCPEYAQRLASNAGGVNYALFTTGEAKAHHLSAFMGACDQIRTLPVWLEGRLDLTPRKLRAGIHEARKRLRERGAKLKLVVVDTVQLMTDDETREGDKENFVLDRVGRALRKLSLDPDFADLTWIVLSQLNSDGELYGTRGFEKHALNVWIVSVDKKARASDILVPEGVHPAKIHVRKNRNGPSPRFIPLWFHERYTRFSESSAIDAGRLGLVKVPVADQLRSMIDGFETANLEARHEDEEGRPSW